jgi:hypothetical protein
MGRKAASKSSASGMRLLKIPFQTSSGEVEKILVQVPESNAPESELVAEVSTFVKTLAANGQLEYDDQESPRPGATHRLRRTPEGDRVLERIGFSAV